jgi:pectate lyase
MRLTALIAALCVSVLAASASAADGPLAFPSAEGFGAISKGGRGGKVVHVTNLNNAGPGSFRAAVMTQGPRIVVFDVGGTVLLDGEVHVQGDNGRITIAGQTAPGGITFVGGTLCFPGWQRNKAHRTPDIIVRHIRVRGTHRHSTHSEGGDCLDVYRAERVIIDHCSFTGSGDETVDACHTQQYTFQWCTIEEPALWGQGSNQHREGSHNYAFIFSYDSKNVSCHHNLFVHSSNRNPLISKGIADIRNNVAYNFHIGMALHGTDPFNVIGNYMKAGRTRPRFITPFYGMGGKDFYFHDNIIDLPGKVLTVNDPRKDTRSERSISMRAPAVLLDKPNVIPHLGATHSAKEAYDIVLAKAGAWPRDTTTRRCVEEVKTRTGSYGLGGPYERFPANNNGPASAKNDTDRDGMPDAWEKAHGLDPKDPADGNKVVPKGASKGNRHIGYTWIEYYINDLADSLVGAKADLCTVEMAIEGKGIVGCESGGWTVGWGAVAAPREVLWPKKSVFNRGSSAVVRAMPAQGYLFDRWEGGSLDGVTERFAELKVDKDVKVTVHFKPDPDYGKPVAQTFKQDNFTTDVKLFTYPSSINAKTSGTAMSMGRDGKVYVAVGDGFRNTHLACFDPKTQKVADLGSVAKSGGWPQGRPFVAADGAVYFATLFNPANHYGVWSPQLGGLFKYTPGAGVTRILKGRETYSLLHGDAKTGKLFVLVGASADNRQRSFKLRTYDTAAGTWQELGKVDMRCSLRKTCNTSIADEHGGFFTSFLPKGTTRFDLATGKLESVGAAPGRQSVKRGKKVWRRFPWQAVASDGKTAYVTTHQWGSLYSHVELWQFKPGDWPDIEFKPMKLIDPKDRLVYTRHLALTPDGKRLVIAGKCLVGKFKPGRFDGIWVIDLASGKRHLVANITGLLKKSFKDEQVELFANEYAGSNVVGKDGWIYLGVRKMPESFLRHGRDTMVDLRLMAVRVSAD